VNALDEFKVSNCITTQRRCKIYGELTELIKMFSQFDVRYVVDDVQQSHCCTRIIHSLPQVSVMFVVSNLTSQHT